MSKASLTIRNIRNAIEGYLAAETEQREAIERGRDGNGHSEDSMARSAKLEGELNSQYNFLEQQLKSVGFAGHPVEMIDIYSTEKLRAITILECL